MDKDIVISIKTVIYTLILFGGLFAIYKLFPMIAIILASALIVIVLEPLVQFFSSKYIHKSKIPRSVAVGLTYVTTLSLFIFALTLGLPPVITQAQRLLATLGIPLSENYFQKLDTVFSDLSQISAIVSTGGVKSLVDAILAVFSNLATVVSVLAISIYMSLDWLNIKERLFGLIPNKYKAEIKDLVTSIETNLGHWAKGQLILMVIVGGMSTLGLLILNIDYALALGLLAALLEAVPYIGPIIAAIFALIVGYSISPVHGVAVLVLYLVIQQVENTILVPKVFQKVSGFSPLVILLAILTGADLFGLVGALVAIPLTMVGIVIFKHVWAKAFLNA